MRQWRVGTFSMGGSLVLLGLFLFLSRFLGLNLANVMTAWWPILLIVLGVEILVYLVLSRSDRQVLKYDFMSIFFVGFLGMVGIVFALLSASGIINKVDEVMARENRSFDLPAFSYQTDQHVKRVVVKTAGYDLSFEATDEKTVSAFGTYQVHTTKNEKWLKTADDYIAATQKGDTLYLNLKPLPNEVGPFDRHGTVAATILIPNDVMLEVNGNANSIALNPRSLENNWKIESESSIYVDVSSTSNIKISAVGVKEVSGKDGEWKVTEKTDSENSVWKNADYQSGDGKYHINITNAYQVSLNTN